MLYVLRYRVQREGEEQLSPLTYQTSPGTKDEIEAEVEFVKRHVPGACDFVVENAEVGD